MRRRAGYGTVSWDKRRNRYQARLWVDRPDGTKARLCKAFTNVKQAESWLRTKRNEADVAPIPEQIKLTKWLYEWIEQKEVTPKSKQTYKTCVNYLCTRARGLLLAEASPIQLDKLISHVPGTRQRQVARSVLKMAYKEALRQGLVSKNPADLTLPISYHKKHQATVISQEAMVKVLEFESDPILRGFWAFCFATGCRPYAEALPLKKDNLFKIEGTYFFRGSKTEAGKRARPIPKTVAEYVLSNARDYLFPGSSGLPLHRRTVSKRWRTICKAVGLGDTWLYDSRHTKATNLAKKGVDPNILAAMMGHSSPEISRKFYVQTTLDDLSKQVENEESEVRNEVRKLFRED